jgi:hypothetical protein
MSVVSAGAINTAAAALGNGKLNVGLQKWQDVNYERASG